jgi:hypothetical protein
MTSRSAAAVGLLVASVIPALFMAVIWPLSQKHDLVSIAGTFIVFFPFSAGATIVIGLPIFLLTSHYRLLRWWTALASGLFAGAIVAFAIRGPHFLNSKDFLIFVPLGAVTSMTFFLIWSLGQKRHL